MKDTSFEVVETKTCVTETCHYFFSTLANPTRLAILETLQDGPKNVAELSRALNREQSMISHNLKPLEQCVFVFSERQGKTRVYRVNREIIDPLFELFAFHASKYCPSGRVCLTAGNFARYKKKEAEKELYISHE
jgi:DNA-binding transcriptional ArsR family regulator